MAKRYSSNSERDSLIKFKKEFEKLIKERIEIGEELYKREVTNSKEWSTLCGDKDFWHDFNLELLRASFNRTRNRYYNEYNWSPMYTTASSTPRNRTIDELITKSKSEINDYLTRLKKIFEKIPLMNETNEIKESNSSQKKLTEATTIQMREEPSINNVFIVHGHNDRMKIEIARTIEKLGLNPIILHEQANRGHTIIEKFETHSDVSFAIILMTCDDLGRVKTGEEDKYRARQNVILEMGYFIGKLGRSKVLPLYEKGVELPSDLYGLLYTPIDDTGNWKFALVKELRATGHKVDANEIL